MPDREGHILEQLIGRGLGLSGVAGRAIQQEALPTLRQALGTSQAIRQTQQQRRIADIRTQAITTTGERLQQRQPVSLFQQFLQAIPREKAPSGPLFGGPSPRVSNFAAKLNEAARIGRSLGLNQNTIRNLISRVQAGDAGAIQQEFGKGGIRSVLGVRGGRGRRLRPTSQRRTIAPISTGSTLRERNLGRREVGFAGARRERSQQQALSLLQQLRGL